MVEDPSATRKSAPAVQRAPTQPTRSSDLDAEVPLEKPPADVPGWMLPQGPSARRWFRYGPRHR